MKTNVFGKSWWISLAISRELAAYFSLEITPSQFKWSIHVLLLNKKAKI